MSKKKGKLFKSKSFDVKKHESDTSGKLTKQQKRDAKRRNKVTIMDTIQQPQKSGENVKLTKQQKRDMKRNSWAKSGECANASIAGAQSIPPQNGSVYKRKTIYPPLYLTEAVTNKFNVPQNRFITQSDDCFEAVLESGYHGFIHSPPEDFSESFHSRFERAMMGLEKEGKYQYDVTQPAGLGTKTALTYVTRCLVGEPGTTYKYLGLRMFSIPWTRDCIGSSEHSIEIGKLNEEMKAKTKILLSERGGKCGSCQYNLTLINRCYPIHQSKFQLKDEPTFKKDKCTVSWHADSTLEHFSTIGVYHVTSASSKESHQLDEKSKKYENDDSWRIAMRVYYDAEGPNLGKPNSRAGEMKSIDKSNMIVPSVAFSLPNKSAYFMLDDFNHHHQHAVLVGNTHRYASTHRVCRTDGHTYQSIKAQCASFLQQRVVFTAKHLRALLNTANILEFEWIRQYYVQGTKHRESHQYWERAIQDLVDTWKELHSKTVQALQVLRDAAAGQCLQQEAVTVNEPCGHLSNRVKKQVQKQMKRTESVEIKSYDVMNELLQERLLKRKDWHTRQTDAIFRKLPPEYRPVDPPLPPYDSNIVEEVVLPFYSKNGNERVCVDSTDAIKWNDVTWKATEISALIDQGIILQWQKCFLSRH